MIITNLIVILIIVLIHIVNIRTLVKPIKNNTAFMYLEYNTNISKEKIKPYKQKLLANSRLSLVVSLIFGIIFALFNKSLINLSIFALIFLLIPILIEQLIIFVSINSMYKNGVLDKNKTSIDLKLIKERLIVNGLVAIALIVFIVYSLNVQANYNKKYDVNTTFTNTEFVIKNNKTQVNLPYKNITKIEKLTKMPEVTSRIDGLQENNMIIGTFNLQGINNASVFVNRKAKSFLIITSTTKTYVVGNLDTKETDNIYQAIITNMPKKTKK